MTAALAGFARSPQAETVAAAPAPTIHFVDREAALSLRYPRGWHRPARLTKIIYPRERLALASHPLPRNDTIGECQAQHSLERMPPDGVFIYLLEFRPPRGKVWAEIRRRDFRPRPKPFRITHRRRSAMSAATRAAPTRSCSATPTGPSVSSSPSATR